MFVKPYIGIGGAIIFLPSLVSLFIFGKSRGMWEAFQIGFNVTFALLGILILITGIYIAGKTVSALRSKE